MIGSKERYLIMLHPIYRLRSNKMVKCTECEAEIKVPEDSVESEIVTCPDCGASYELVKSDQGFTIRPAQTVGEDWGQ
jgi:alpha-aminoadipate/glutamate carrier protein LysW